MPAPGTSEKLKSEEEYLLRYEDQLLAVTTEHMSSVNHTMLFVYTVGTVSLLVANDSIELLPFFFFKMDCGASSNLKPMVATFAPTLIGFALCYCAYSVYMIRKALSRFNGNAARLVRINPVARPISRSSIRLRRSGLIGVWLYVARKLVGFFSKKGAKTGPGRTLFAMVGLLLTLGYLVAMFWLPVGVASWVFFSFGEPRFVWSLSLMSLAAILLLLVVGQLVIRDALAYIAVLEMQGKRNVFEWFFRLLKWLDARFPKDDSQDNVLAE